LDHRTVSVVGEVVRTVGDVHVVPDGAALYRDVRRVVDVDGSRDRRSGLRDGGSDRPGARCGDSPGRSQREKLAPTQRLHQGTTGAVVVSSMME
jgi:hypothetical protein